MKIIVDKLRAWPWLVGAIVAIVVIGIIAPHQIGVLIWSLSKLSLGAYLGYWIHRSFEKGLRPHEMPAGPERDNALLRRFIVVAASILALGLGV